MSRLQELRLHGFKSFAEPTRFTFEPGVTAVIGPNGSGKSNMADAIRWVLGEQSNRSLRTRRADDVIFAGSEARRPIGMAEVALTLDNHDGWLPIEFESVTITRRAYRSGDPEYLINGSRARLRDVVELLAAGRLGANELVVVGQGTVDAALSLRPDERRQLFEEAAGVKSLQVRRNEALSRLGRARENLTRVSDLVRELRPQVRRLALQAEHQEAHDRLGGRARALVLEHHARRGQVLQSSLGEARRRAAAVTADIGAERAAQATGRQAVEQAEERYWAGEHESARAASDWEAAREAVIRAEGRHDSLVERDLDLAAEADRATRELAELTAEEPITGEPTSAARTDPLRESASAAQQLWYAAAERAREADGELLAAEEALATVRGREADRLAETGHAVERAVAASARRERLEQERIAAETAQMAAIVAVADLAEVRRQAAVELEQAEARMTPPAEEREAAAAEATRAGVALAELDERAARIKSDLAEMEGAGDDATQDLVERLRADGWTTLRDGLRPVPPGVALAVAAVLGDVERAFLWRPGADAALGDTTGDAHLVRPANGTPPGREAALGAVGATHTLAEVLGERVAPDVLHRTVVAPGIEALLEGWPRLPDGWAAVTLSGDLADARGVVTVRGRAGEVRAQPTRGARRTELVSQMARLEADLGAARKRQATANAALQRASAAADAALAAVEAARIGRRRADEEAATADGRLARVTDERDALATELAALLVTPAIPALPTDLERELAGLEAASLEARVRRDTATAERDAARDAWHRAVLAADAHDANTVDRRTTDARHAERRDQLEQRLARLAAEREALATGLAEATSTLTAARAAEESASNARLRAEEARAMERQTLLDAERQLGGGSGRLAELESTRQQVVAEVSRLDEALAGLDRERELSLEGLPEPVGLDAPEAEGEPTPDRLADDDLAEEMRKTRRTLQQIGSVNPFAIQEHRELSARLEVLSSQETDLRGAAESTEALIARLDVEIGQQFQAAFAAIGQRFDEYCQLLFAGGSATLELTEDAESEAPGGIEIAVRPPGKRLQRLAMLSGGERALAGVALLFAMLSVNPVPFCILDEVDAALDEANITRFADALRRLAQTIDFVVITHNRATIETADTIYGVTMTDAAVSRVLSLRLADLPVEVSA
ncbi:MAG: chromosome segregation protein SMC [Candidatus Limnocylindria bacterium]